MWVRSSAPTIWSALAAFMWTARRGTPMAGSAGQWQRPPHHTPGCHVRARWPQLTWHAARHAFAWTESTGMLDLGTLGGRDSAPVDVNDAGHIVGWAYTPNDVSRLAFLWTALIGW